MRHLFPVEVCSVVGSGSSAWAYNVSKVSEDTISNIIKELGKYQSEDVKDKLSTCESFHFEHT